MATNVENIAVTDFWEQIVVRGLSTDDVVLCDALGNTLGLLVNPEDSVVVNEETGMVTLNFADGSSATWASGGGTAGQIEFQAGEGGDISIAQWRGTKQQYDALADDIKLAETFFYITNDVSLVSDGGEARTIPTLAELGLSEQARDYNEAAIKLSGVRLGTAAEADVTDFITPDSATILTNKSGAISQWDNDAGYITTQTSQLDVVDSSSTITVIAAQGQDNGGIVDSTGNLTITVNLPEVGITVNDINVGDFTPFGLWNFSSATLVLPTSSVTEAQLNSTVNASLDLADSALQTGDADLTPDWVPDDNPHYLTFVANGTISEAQLNNTVNASLDLADSALQSISAGSITETELSTSVNTSLDLADSSLQTLPEITESDLNTSINASLDLADSAIQSTNIANDSFTPTGTWDFSGATVSGVADSLTSDQTIAIGNLPITTLATPSSATNYNLNVAANGTKTWVAEDDYLPLTGGTMSGSIVFSNGQTFPIQNMPSYVGALSDLPVTSSDGDIAYLSIFEGDPVVYNGTSVSAPVMGYTSAGFFAFLDQDLLVNPIADYTTSGGSGNAETPGNIETLSANTNYFTISGNAINFAPGTASPANAGLQTDGFTLVNTATRANLSDYGAAGTDLLEGLDGTNLPNSVYLYKSPPTNLQGIYRFNGTTWIQIAAITGAAAGGTTFVLTQAGMENAITDNSAWHTATETQSSLATSTYAGSSAKVTVIDRTDSDSTEDIQFEIIAMTGTASGAGFISFRKTT